MQHPSEHNVVYGSYACIHHDPKVKVQQGSVAKAISQRRRGQGALESEMSGTSCPWLKELLLIQYLARR
jgi:hypothetical protein